MPDMIKIGGLWTNKDRNGDTFLTGKLSPVVKILIFKNQYRESENHPTHIMYLAPVETQSQVAEGEDEFSPDQAPRNTYAAPEDYAEAPPAQSARRPMAPRSAAPPPRNPAPARAAAPARGGHRQPSPPPDFDDDGLSDPFAE